MRYLLFLIISFCIYRTSVLVSAVCLHSNSSQKKSVHLCFRGHVFSKVMRSELQAGAECGGLVQLSAFEIFMPCSFK